MSQTEQQNLDGTTVGIYIAPEGTEEVEFTEPKQAVSDAGADVDILGSEQGEAQTVNNDLDQSDSYEVDKTFDDVSHDEYDALVVPGGTVGADKLRVADAAVDLIEQHVNAGKPAGVICHGPWVLVEADLVANRTVTSYHSLTTDIQNAGGEWVDEEVVIDQELITSRNPDDLDAFCEAILDEFATVTAEQ